MAFILCFNPLKFIKLKPPIVYMYLKTLRRAHHWLHCNVQTNRDMVAYGFFSSFLDYQFLYECFSWSPIPRYFWIKKWKKQTLVSSHRMRSSLVVRASDCQCTSCNGPGFDPSIRRHSGIWGAADEAVLNIVRKKQKKNQKIFFFKKCHYIKQRCHGIPNFVAGTKFWFYLMKKFTRKSCNSLNIN